MKHSTFSLTANGTRVSLVPYLDPPIIYRKEILNRLRSGLLNTSPEINGQTGGVRSTSPASTSDLDQLLLQHLGMGFDAVRSTLFQRGGNAAPFILVASRLAGVPVITKEEIERACDQLKAQLIGQLDGTFPTVNDGVEYEWDPSARYSSTDHDI